MRRKFHKYNLFDRDDRLYIQELEDHAGVELGFLVNYPHCLSRATLGMTRVIARETNEPIGVISDHSMCLENEQGERTYDSPTPENFRQIWSLHANQRALWQGDFIVQDTTVSVVVPAKMRPHLIQQAYDTFEVAPGQAYTSAPYMEVIVKMIDELRWLFLPLTEDYPHGGVFVTRADMQSTVTAVVESLYEKHQEAYRVEQKNGKFEIVSYPRPPRHL